MSASKASGFIALVPAGGSGARMGAGTPKQYRLLGNIPVIAHTLRSLLAQPWIQAVHVVVAPDDTVWQQQPTLVELTTQSSGRLIWHNRGGVSRQATVLAGLEQIDTPPNPWVLIHDAARPGLSASELVALKQAVESSNGGAATDKGTQTGALLATRVADTVKVESTSQPGIVESTTPRDHLWLAQTPQVFPLQLLLAVLRDAQGRGVSFTDEASAMEAAGHYPQLVPGSWRNFKLTTAPDMEKAAMLLGLSQTTAGESND